MNKYSLFVVLLFCITIQRVTSHTSPSRLSLYNALNARFLHSSSSSSPESSSVSSTVTVDVTPTLINDGDYVNVTITNPNPTSDDFIASFSPSTYASVAHSPVEYFLLNAFPSYLKTGTVTVPFRCINMRSDYAFALFSGGLNNPVEIAHSVPVTFHLPNEPLHPRLAVTTNPGELRVTWSSGSNAASNPQVYLALAADPSNGKWYPADNTYTYTAADMCGAPATTIGYRDVGYIHTLVLKNIQPSTPYLYSIGDNTSAQLEIPFTSLPVGGPSSSIVIAAVGDVGQNPLDGASDEYMFPTVPNMTQLISQDIENRNVQGFLHVGDISYARGYQSEWEMFLDLIAGTGGGGPPYGRGAFASRVPYMINLGNHERDFPGSVPVGPNNWGNGTDSEGECGVPAVNLFPMPQPCTGTQCAYWAASLGPIFTVHFSTELDFSIGSAQYNFIKNALTTVDRSVTPWVIVGFHRPMYISSTNWDPVNGDQTVAIALRENIEPLFANAGGSAVDLVLSGHHHSYQRWCAVLNNGTCYARSQGPDNVYVNPQAPVQLVIGTGGAGFSTNIQTPPPPAVEIVNFWHGYIRIEIFNSSALYSEFVDDTTGGTIRDSFWILK